MTDEWNQQPPLRGEHVHLEALTAEHAEGLLKAGDDPAIWTWLSTRQPADLDGMRAFVAKALSDPARLCWVQLDAHTGEVAGTTSYYQWDAEHRIVSIGHTWIGKPWQRTALNTEAKLLLLRRAFGTLNAGRVAWETDIKNERSQRAIGRLGAKREGVLRAHRIRPDGSVRDTVVYSVTAAEWPSVERGLAARLA
ncbi:MAG: GCN5-related N-acetyltransferase [Amycolatopsis sp.]|uniref:GNAT family N-acetyltransferase n=1 Tax=Amycolatopsis sp. TaxID=37632 RepID=UPI0026058780|nr:GNAT family protein [Amycolatopsis sp.]MCU1684974.1 GCN5-related N-acetyltransferase [Amycolatopsis sp.]